MRFDLKTPCRNCPFRTDDTAIRFSCRERAEEIEETAYRYGFPCHLSAELNEDDEDGGFEFGAETQHCAGALIMYLRDGGGNVVWERLAEEEQERISSRLDFSAPVFEGPEEFLDRNGKPELEGADDAP